jgi:acyl carrier protein
MKAREGSMIDEDIKNRVLAVFKRNRRVGELPLNMDTSFDQLEFDSLEVFCIVFDLEDEFNITIPDDSAKTMRTIGDVVRGVTSALPAGAAGATPTESQV